MVLRASPSKLEFRGDIARDRREAMTPTGLSAEAKCGYRVVKKSPFHDRNDKSEELHVKLFEAREDAALALQARE